MRFSSSNCTGGAYSALPDPLAWQWGSLQRSARPPCVALGSLQRSARPPSVALGELTALFQTP